jgi:hypothetical protein
MQERVLSEPVYLLDDFLGSMKVHMAKVGKALETMLTSSSLPASLKKLEVLLSFLPNRGSAVNYPVS